MPENDFKLKRALWMTTPVVLVLVLYLGIGPMLNWYIKASERSNSANVLQLALYRQGLEPCNVVWSPNFESLSATPDDLVIEIYPAFRKAHGLIVSGEKVQLYCDASWHLPPPPPSPSRSGQTIEHQSASLRPKPRFGPAAPLHPGLMTRIITSMRWEIDHASDHYPRSGLDGVSYMFFHDGQCASAWSPQPNTRADKILDVVRGLIALIEATAGSQTDEAHRYLGESLTVLNHDRRRFEASDTDSVVAADKLRELAAHSTGHIGPTIDVISFEALSTGCENSIAR